VVTDFPISCVYIALTVGNHGAVAIVWLVVGGTLWWYVLCRTAEKVLDVLKDRPKKESLL
jgi:fructose-1,6-bisphosphatase/inositol monophosphatase family enzyme